ncbi:tRNA (adenine22-N1)-methyltransferase [Caldanaerobius fijiensis DSM 17918]|uniref:tRNA (Adenine22-N1)-methyltransferase n=2 Tax=Caldanaerobius TaxID=862261 RepID=A0A1M4SC86_9THEO|nr:tRNA (adenine22-N1)-methyltransferase [Caldanaerobius fijiensis DSM 17918]
MTSPYIFIRSGIDDMKLKLGKRLKAIVDMVDRCGVAAEIGTDHGKIPVYLVENAIVQKVVASDISGPSLEKAIRLAEKAGVQEAVDFRLGDGLKVLRPGEADTIIIAGMGGDLTVHMLVEGKDIVGDAVLVLQPMKDDSLLRRCLIELGYCIVDEDLAEERDKIYTIIKAKKGHMNIKENIFLEIGPILYRKRHPLLWRYIDYKIGLMKDILRQKEDVDLAYKIREMEAMLNELKMS